jgi:hypothetical protein
VKEGSVMLNRQHQDGNRKSQGKRQRQDSSDRKRQSGNRQPQNDRY